MSKAATSVFVFAMYLFGLGLFLMLAPNTLMQAFGLPDVQDIWVRVVGMLMVLIGGYYSAAARSELTPFLQWTVYARSSVMVFFAAFVFTGLATNVLLLFGAIDLMAAIWTHVALKADAQAQAQAD